MPPRKPHVPSLSHAAWSTVEPSHAKSQSRENRSTLAPRPPPQMNYMFPPQTTAEPASETPKEAEKRHRKQISALRVDHANALYAIEGKQMSEAAKALTEEAAHRTEMNAFKAESERTCALLQEQIQQLQASLMMMHAGDRPAVAGTTSKRTTSVALTTPPRNKHSSEALLNKVLRNTSSALAIAEVSKSGKLTKISTSPATKATRNRYTALQDDEEEEEDVSVLTYYDDFANENESVTAMSVKSSADASEESETYNVGELSLVRPSVQDRTTGPKL